MQDTSLVKTGQVDWGVMHGFSYVATPFTNDPAPATMKFGDGVMLAPSVSRTEGVGTADGLGAGVGTVVGVLAFAGTGALFFAGTVVVDCLDVACATGLLDELVSWCTTGVDVVVGVVVLGTVVVGAAVVVVTTVVVVVLDVLGVVALIVPEA